MHAAVRLAAGATATEAELAAFVKAELDAVKAPKRVQFVTELPSHPAGKISRRGVRKMVLGENDTGS